MVTIRGYNYTVDDDRIAKDFFTGNWDLKEYMTHGLSNLKQDGSCETVYFVDSPSLSATLSAAPLGINMDHNTGYILDKSYVNWVECPDNGIFYAPPKAHEYIANDRARRNNIFMEEYKHSTPSDEVLSKIRPTYTDNKGIKHPINTYVLTEGKPYTFGVELELSSGIVPEYERSKYLMTCVRDGSLNGRRGGPEFVTGVLTGDQGIMHLQDICAQLGKRGILNNSCGMHVHVGNMNFSRYEVVCAYKLGKMLQDELMAMQPPSRRNNEYCKKLPNVADFVTIKGGKQSPEEFKIDLHKTYDSIFEHIAGTSASRHANKLTDHPRGGHCGYDRSTMRYCWLNFVPSVFNTRGQRSAEPTMGFRDATFSRSPDGRWTMNRTITAPAPTPAAVTKVRPTSYTFEFRLHFGTVDFRTTLMWLLICMAFCNYVENYQQDILTRNTITLKEVITKTFPKSANTLLAYIDSRRRQFNSLSFEEDTLYSNAYYGANITPTPLKTLLKEIQQDTEQHVHNKLRSSRNRQDIAFLD